MIELFEVEYLQKDQKGKLGSYVLVRQINKGNHFAITEHSQLSGIELKPFLSSPRALDKEGKPRTDLFVFTLKDRSQITAFTVGQIVELSSPTDSPPPA